jgi:AcrR family transcriptional regulator
MSTRAELIRQALALFAERGYDAAGVQEICDAAGVTKPTLYHHFGSKRGLLEALLVERYLPFLGEMVGDARYDGDLPAVLERVVARYFRFASGEPELYRMVLGLWFASATSEATRILRPLREQQERALEGLFARAANDHGKMRGKQRSYAMTFLGMIHTHIGLALDGELELNDTILDRAVQQYSHGIY